MSENPFQSPASDFAVGVKSGRREDLKNIATYQKGILVCILIYLLTIVGNFFIPEDVQILLGLALAVLGVVSTVFVFLLAIKVYNTGVGILLGLLALVPCLGLIVLLVINGKATRILQQNGHKVGLLGADLSQF
ncbi:MAG TPA: hypothetical protein VHC19_01500 [Pirellulales bacterium]|nr:hypothetical protein [Pirellulales bacterium]